MKYLIFSIALLFGFAQAQSQEDLKVDIVKSYLNWKGEKVIGSHWGKVYLKGGELRFDNNNLIGGNFAIDMQTLHSLDLKENEGKAKLEGHLKSDDFFAVERFPEAYFSITKITPIGDAKTGEPNYTIEGDLKIRNKTNLIKFPVRVVRKGSWASAKAKITIDRTLWDIKFNSGNFFENLGDKMIKDEIVFDVDLTANK